MAASKAGIVHGSTRPRQFISSIIRVRVGVRLNSLWTLHLLYIVCVCFVDESTSLLVFDFDSVRLHAQYQRLVGSISIKAKTHTLHSTNVVIQM
jgi:hypothetical protein